MALKFKNQYEFPAKKFFYATSNFVFKELPYIEAQFKERVEQFNDEFFGNPEKILWEAPVKEDEENQEIEEEKKEEQEEKDPEDFLNVSITDSEEEAKKKIVLLTQFKELHRLSYVIRAIEMECAVVPVGSLKL